MMIKSHTFIIIIISLIFGILLILMFIDMKYIY